MRILGPFIFFLLAGIISSIVAQKQIQNQNHIHESAVQQKKSVTDEISNGLIAKVTKISRTIFQQNIANRMGKKDKKYDDQTTACDDSNDENASANLDRCIRSLVEITQFEAEMAAARSNDGENTVIGNYCRKVPAFKNCLENVMESIKPCLDSKDRKSVNILHEITSSNIQKYQRCSIKLLGKCKSSVPAAITNDLFNFIDKETSCDILLNPQLAVESKEEEDSQGLSGIPPKSAERSLQVKRREERSPGIRFKWPKPHIYVPSIGRGIRYSSTRGRGSHASPTSIVDVLALTVAMIIHLRFA